jgi:hypothetical protein
VVHSHNTHTDVASSSWARCASEDRRSSGVMPSLATTSNRLCMALRPGSGMFEPIHLQLIRDLIGSRYEMGARLPERPHPLDRRS